ncbi:hypothetical protein ACWGKK_36720 [Streptomyces chartreusis]
MIIPDPNSPVGEAVISLHQEMTDLRERRGDWPGADAVTILESWLEQFDFTRLPDPAVVHIPPPRPGQVWVLRRWDRHENGIELFADEASAFHGLAEHVRQCWDNVTGEEGVPEEPPMDDRKAVDLYYGPERNNRPDEGYSLYADTISRKGRPRVVPLDFQFPDVDACERAHRRAVFHPGTGGDLPCLMVDGVLVFAYLDHEVGAFRISVHLDSAPDRLVRTDGTVPLRIEVEVEDRIVHCEAESAPKPALLDALLSAAEAARIRTEPILAAAVAAGFMWRCPECQWTNPRAATCCEGPGPCQKPWPGPGVAAQDEVREP